MRRDQPSIHQRANGRWSGILSALGVEAPLLNVRKHHPCPWCGGKDRFRFTDKDGGGSFLCGQCGRHSPIDLLMLRRGWDFPVAAQEIEKLIGSVPPVAVKDPRQRDTKADLNSLWRDSRPVTTGDPVDLWLRSRLGSVNVPNDLRYCRSCRHTGDNVSYHPAMLAKVTAPNGAPVTIHRTYLTSDGHRADVEPQRMLMPGSFPAGSAVRLAPPAEEMGIAEGVETAFAATLLFGIPVWAALTAGALEKWEPPADVRRLTIFADNDVSFTGQAAAYTLAKRSGGSSIHAQVKVPDQQGEDWNDVLLRQIVGETK